MRLVAKPGILIGLGLMGCGLVLAGTLFSNAQVRRLPSRPGQGETYVVIEREPAVLVPPKTYQVSLSLEPAKHLQLAPLKDGIVQRVSCETGQKLEKEAEALRMDDRDLQLMLERAKANYRAAELELRRAQNGKDADLVEIAEAKKQAAKAELDLAELRSRQAVIRAPFDGEILRVHVIDGEWVRAGQPLAELADTTKLQVEIPVDRQDENSAPGKTVKLRMDDVEVEGTIETILPPAEKFDPLRDLVGSVASAIVVLDNSEDQYAVGQTVHSPLVPRHPVCEVAKSSIKSQSNGQWKLQVIRKGVVHDLSVSALGRLGEDRMYVSGPFAKGDQVITSTSQELPDGTQVTQDPRANPQLRRQGTPVRLPSDPFDDGEDPS